MTGLSLFFSDLSQSRRLPLLQVVSNNKSFSVGVQFPTEINAPRGCAVILRRICQLTLTRITHQVSRAFDLNLPEFLHRKLNGIAKLHLRRSTRLPQFFLLFLRMAFSNPGYRLREYFHSMRLKYRFRSLPAQVQLPV